MTSPVTVEEVERRLQVVHQRIIDAGGSLERTGVLAVTKTFDDDLVDVAVAAGLTELGENYAQELLAKAATPRSSPITWHMIGGLQRNKVKKLAGVVGVWQTVDRPELVAEIAKRAPGATIHVQVNTTDEAQKSGCEPSVAPALIDQARQLGLDVVALMTIGPTGGGDPRPAFASLRELAEQCEVEGLSMGMSADLEQAVAEGSTLVRVGTALFGPRTPRAG